MTKSEQTEITIRSLHAYLIEQGYFDHYNKWVTHKIKEYEKQLKTKNHEKKKDIIKKKK